MLQALGVAGFSLALWLAPSGALAEAPELDAAVIRAEREFPGLGVVEQRRILEFLAKQGPGGRNLAAYYLDPASADLRWLNPALLSRLHAMNRPGSESNCYWTSLFALGLVGLPERFMDLPEYLAAVQSGRFSSVDAEGPYEPGDVLRMRRVRGGMDTHSVVYLGKLRGEAFVDLVLSKNGPSDGPYLVMELRQLGLWAYPSSRVMEAYRLRK